MGLREDLGAISKVCRRIVIGMAENLILLIPDGVDAVDEFHIFREDGTDGEGVNPGSAAFLLFKVARLAMALLIDTSSNPFIFCR